MHPEAFYSKSDHDGAACGKARAEAGKLIYPDERWSPMQKSSDSNDLNG